jgi:hypothetical protein
VKTHYELLGVAPSADAETIKKAFRKEIAKYHPDKVIHLGHEFQEMASVRAAELTVAYKTLTDEAMRAQYDASLGVTGASPAPAAEDAPPSQAPYDHTAAYVRPPQVHDAWHSTEPVGSPNRFDSERAGRDQILLRALEARVHKIAEDMYGALQTPKVRGFDFALVPTAMPRFLGSPPPRVLIRVLDQVDAAAVTEAFANAARARVHVAKSPVIVLLFAKQIAPQGELLRVIERQRKAADGPDEIAIIALDTDRWSARMAPGVSAVVRKFVDRLKQ